MSNAQPDVERIFLEALRIEDFGKQTQFLDRECGSNVDLRKQIEELLVANQEMSRFLDQTQSQDSSIALPLPTGSSIGSYKLVEQIGQGGMGVVFVAQQEEPVKREVALKIIRPGMDTSEVLARFEQERQALAMMDHPNIAKVLDAGATSEGRPYFVMELVRGTPITQYCDTQKLSNPRRLELFIDVCKAIQHAHQKGVIHRDIKPGNVLVTSFDGKPVVKVIDFGVAKAVSQSLTDKTVYTQLNQLIGTPIYMSPEQAELNSVDIDTRSDIYALGVLLYELITGTTPIEKKQLQQAALDEMLRLIREEIPPRPSRKISRMGDAAITVSGNRSTSSRKLIQSLHDDIDWIVMKSLEKDRGRRYETADAFAMDIERFLNCQPVLAGPPSFAYRTRKFIERNRNRLLTVLILLGLLGIGLWLTARNMNATHAKGLVESTLTSQISEAPRLIQALEEYQHWVEPSLRARLNDPDLDESKELRIRLALLPNDPKQVPFLAEKLTDSTASEFTVIRDALEPYKSNLLESLWNLASDKTDPVQQFAAACALASYAPENSRWSNAEFCDEIVKQLLLVLPSELAPWRDALRPVQPRIISPLMKRYVDKEIPQAQRLYATTTLSAYASNNPDLLFELLVESDDTQFELMFQGLNSFRDQAIQLGTAELSSNSTEKNVDSRKANAGVMLIRMGAESLVWPMLAHSKNPTNRSYMIHRMAALGCNPQKLLAQFRSEEDVSIRRAILLAIGEFDIDRIENQAAFSNELLDIYRDNNDAGLHGAAEWLLRKWQFQDQLVEADLQMKLAEDQIAQIETDRTWFVNQKGQTFAILDADQFEMGSHEHEPHRRVEEILHQRKIDRRFAIATKEITVAQWREFYNDVNDLAILDPDHPQLRTYIPSEQCPMTGQTWYEAAQFCNWLSEQLRIPKEQWCYEPNEKGIFGPGMKAKDKFWELTGYRLPTESEWEYACNANATTGRYFGDPDDLLDHYAWYMKSANSIAQDIGLKKPNDFGLFDILGNAFERCYDEFEDYPVDDDLKVLEDKPPSTPITESRNYVLRGGSFYYFGAYARSAYRVSYSPSNRISNYGLRIVRTMPNTKK